LAGTSPRKALQNFVEPLQLAVSCICKAVFTYLPPEDPSLLYTLLLANGEKVKLPGPDRYTMTVLLNYTFAEVAGERGPWKVSTKAYFYTIEDREEREVISFQWHPGTEATMFPHIHLGHAAQVRHGQLQKAHIPTGRVALEDVLLFAIRELKVTPRKVDWQQIIMDTRDTFIKWRTWG